MRSFSGSLWLFVVTLVAPVVLAEQGPEWTIYHSWDGGNQFTRRGTLEWKGQDDGFVVNNDAESLTKEQVASMLDFGWYHVKIDTTDGDYVLATVPACNLRRANFKDEFSITLPRVAANDLQITSVAYAPLISPLAPSSCEEYSSEQLVPETIALTSKVQATLDTPGMTLRTVLPKLKPPPGYSWLSHPNSRKGSASTSTSGGAPGGTGGGPAGEGGEEETDNRPFFIKYWYVVVPLALANFLPAGGEPAPTGDAGEQGEATGAVAAAAPPPTGAGEATSKRAARRGKRG